MSDSVTLVPIFCRQGSQVPNFKALRVSIPRIESIFGIRNHSMFRHLDVGALAVLHIVSAPCEGVASTALEQTVRCLTPAQRALVSSRF